MQLTLQQNIYFQRCKLCQVGVCVCVAVTFTTDLECVDAVRVLQRDHRERHTASAGTFMYLCVQCS